MWKLRRAFGNCSNVRKFAVHVAHDGDEGFAALTHDRFDVAIVDIGLPKRDGFTVARQARAAGIQTPMLMLTARDAVEDRVRDSTPARRLPDQAVR